MGWWQWRKRGARSQVKVKARRLDGKLWAVTAALFLCGTVITYFVLNAIGGAETAARGIRYMILFDALVFVLNVLGQVLMSLAFVEQWIVWILVNVFSILLWAGKASSSPDTSYTVVMVIKYSFYFMNSLNGLRIWLNLSRESR